MASTLEKASVNELRHFRAMADERTREEPYDPDVWNTARNFERSLKEAISGRAPIEYAVPIPRRAPDPIKTHSDDPVEQFLIDARLDEYMDRLKKEGYAAILKWDARFKPEDAERHFCDKHHTYAKAQHAVHNFNFWALSLAELAYVDRISSRYFAAKRFEGPGTVVHDWRIMINIHEKNIGDVVMPAWVFPGCETDLILVFRDNKPQTAHMAYEAANSCKSTRPKQYALGTGDSWF